MIYFNNVDKQFVKLLEKVYKAFRREFAFEDCFELELNFISDEEIRILNKKTRDVDKVTDVLSFPNIDLQLPFDINNYLLDINPRTNRLMLGEVDISLNKLKEQALEYNHSLERELAYLFTHALLHLIGYDHIDENDKVKMREKEENILRKLKLNIK